MSGGIHFVGIGGIGMIGIAEVMHNLGYRVQGSDIAESANVERLRGRGIKVAIGHRAENLGDARRGRDLDRGQARQSRRSRPRSSARVPVVRRAEMLAELMRLKCAIAVAGTHGKTTTTSMIAALLDAGGLDPTVINGGIINAYGSNARLGRGRLDGGRGRRERRQLPAPDGTIAVVTNIDPEHLDHYGSFDAVKERFRRASSRTCRSTARPCSASIIPRSRR